MALYVTGLTVELWARYLPRLQVCSCLLGLGRDEVLSFAAERQRWLSNCLLCLCGYPLCTVGACPLRFFDIHFEP